VKRRSASTWAHWYHLAHRRMSGHLVCLLPAVMGSIGSECQGWGYSEPVHVIHWPAREVFVTIRRVQEAAAKIEDPIDRARALEVAAGNVPELQFRIRQARADAIREAMQTGTATSVAQELGISRARLYQVLADVDD
jgi:hypothetical protein